jgi:small subunit ribosomal protein S1
MESNHLGRRTSSDDDAYWASLVEPEESLYSTVSDPEPDTNWLPDMRAHRLPAVDGYMAASLAESWRTAEVALQNDQTLELLVTGYNKGGLLVVWNGLQGFVPASQLADFPHFHLETARYEELKRRQNQYLQLKIIELDAGSNRLILSERAALVAAEARQELLDEIRPGECRPGQVTNLSDFGVFIDLGGLEGLVHISELSWGRVNHPSDVVQPGQMVNVLVLNVNREVGRIALSLKRLKPDPWLSVEERYRPGQMVEGVISSVVNFGAFAILEEGLEGLIHISELAEGTFLHPRNVVNKGDRVRARVLNVDGRNRRLALSLRDTPSKVVSSEQ